MGRLTFIDVPCPTFYVARMGSLSEAVARDRARDERENGGGAIVDPSTLRLLASCTMAVAANRAREAPTLPPDARNRPAAAVEAPPAVGRS